MTAPTPTLPDLLHQANTALRQRRPAGALLSRAYHTLCAQALADGSRYPDRLSSTLGRAPEPSGTPDEHVQAAQLSAAGQDWSGAARHVAHAVGALHPGEAGEAFAWLLEHPWLPVQGQLMPDAGTFNDEDNYIPDTDRYDRRKLKVTCPNCARVFAPHMSRFTQLVESGMSWSGCDHQEPYALFVTRCRPCTQPFTFRTFLPQ